MTNTHAPIATITATVPGAEYTITHGDGTTTVLSDGQIEYWALAAILDGEYSEKFDNGN